MFITFEGSDGSGKSTQAPALVDYLRECGYNMLYTREPGGTAISEQIRAILFGPDNADMLHRTEILLFQAARAQLVEQVVRPHLKRGGLVVSDRYADSTLAYQGYGYQLDLGPLKTLISFATGGLKPDLTLLLEIDVEEGLRRRAQGGNKNRLDTYDLGFYQRVSQGYSELATEEPERWVKIDANPPPDQVQAAVQRVVMERLERKT